MLALTLSRFVVEWALGCPCCELKHNGEGVTSLSSRLCGMKHNARAGELAFASTRSQVGELVFQDQAPKVAKQG